MKQITFVILALALLVITGCSTQQTQQPGPNASLTNTYWKLADMNGEPVKTPERAREVHLKFVEDGKRLQGFAGCNGIGGDYILGKDNKITLKMITTQMYCDRMEVENYLSNAINKANKYRISGEKLFLLKDNETLATFEAVYL